MKECPSCGARVTGNPTICPECGAALAVQQEYLCMNCEQSFFGQKTTCPHCGSTNIYQKKESLHGGDE